MRVVQALHWLRDMLQSDPTATVKRLTALLNNATHGAALRDDLRHGLHTLPTWMQQIVRPLVDREKAPVRRAPARSRRSMA
jgi:hypothetical protein